MQLVNYYDQIEGMINKTASFYYKFSGMSFEDLKQELWLKLIQEDFSEIKMVKRTIENRAKNICRDNAKYQKDVCCYFEDEVETYTYVSEYMMEEESRLDLAIYDEEYVKSFIASFEEQERIYLIVKGYLVGNLDFFEKEYNILVDCLGLKKKSYLEESKKYLDDVIGKYFLDFNHMSMWKFKKNLMDKMEVLTNA